MKKKEAPLVSVLMPAYNAESFIEQAIQSILTQTYFNIELLICDDASEDHTAQIINKEQDRRIAYFQNKKNKGYLITCNFLLSKARGSFITFQDADDFSRKDRIEKLLNCLLSTPDLGACSSQYVKINEKGDKVLYKSSFVQRYEEIKSTLPNEFPFIGAGIMVRVNTLKQVGLYNEYFNRIGSEDLYWFSKIVLKHKVVNLSEYLYYYRGTSNSITANKNINLRKLVSTPLVKELIRHEMLYGYDPLEKGDLLMVKAIEENLFKQKVPQKLLFIRLAQAEDYKNAFKLLLFIIVFQPKQELKFYKDSIYYIRKFIKGKLEKLKKTFIRR